MATPKKKQPPNSGSINDTEEARRRQAAAVAARRRNQAARNAAIAAAISADGAELVADGAAVPTSPRTVAERAKADAIAKAQRLIPASARVRLERLFPAWCRGYLETIDATTIAETGLDDYLREVWGGERFKITVKDDGRELWTAADAFIGGRPRYLGTELQPPRAIPYNPPDDSAPRPVQQAPAPVASDPALAQLAAAVVRIGEQTAEALRRLPTQAPPSPRADAPGAGRDPGLDGVLRSIDQAVAVRERLDRLAPPPQQAQADTPADDGRSRVADRVTEKLVERGIDLLFDERKAAAQAPGNGGAAGATQVRPPPPARDDDADDVPRAEQVS
jgi:hypothetical protein